MKHSPLNLHVRFDDGVHASEVVQVADQLEAQIRERFPLVKHAYVKGTSRLLVQEQTPKLASQPVTIDW